MNQKKSSITFKEPMMYKERMPKVLPPYLHKLAIAHLLGDGSLQKQSKEISVSDSIMGTSKKIILSTFLHFGINGVGVSNLMPTFVVRIITHLGDTDSKPLVIQLLILCGIIGMLLGEKHTQQV